MNNNGFGFSFGFGPSGDDDNDRNNGFGNFSGGLGDMFNQLGAMLSGLGSSMNSPEGQGAVNYELAERIAHQQISSNGVTKEVSDKQRQAVEESVRLAELWLDDATYLPASGNKVEAWNASSWLKNTLPMWQRMITPVAEHLNDARLETLPQEIRDSIGPMVSMMNQMSGMNFGMQLGHALGDLACQALSGSDFGIQVAPAGVTALLPESVDSIAAEIGVAPQEFMVYLSAREAARQRLFRHVPWLAERLVASVEEYAAGLEIDTSHIEEASREFNIESTDPAEIQDAIMRLQEMDLEPRISSRNASATSRLETLLALIEGWVDFVVTEAMSERVPSTLRMNEAWRNRRSTGGSAEKAFASVVGIEFGAPKVGQAHELWRRVTNAVGESRRDQIWDHPDFLPMAEHLDNSADFIDSLLDEADSADFDPIAEITALEEMLSKEAQEGSDSKDSEHKRPEDDEEKE
ncbi:zinc-dependent metalloprotease [Corynebacterium felinum]|uniref:Hydrolase n=1 Tax=Corynebacterium felinum TaxID=131318 RepID=A0ABU2BB37_9CORY|nr:MULTISPECIES: zinc-dependent metalloprotease [Corynebacterium]MDF5821092.1 zinc-dependent metalloprotease [Corynebacterium felinum]MDO4761216.1 zinc-dependent metalloprotease [Corynebacterium sp.]MDR7354958.1 putative hydrolase [Corynebacterium felinum]WJY94315.1 hypothetical protein CFELI_03365 [Corynebacterium felinum]